MAVDAGGTKTAVWLVDRTDSSEARVLGRGRSTAGNPLSVGFTEATRVIAEAVAQAHDDAGLPPRRVPQAILSVAGAANHHLAERFLDWSLQTRLADRVAVVSDVLPVLAAGTPDCCGVALIAGTGSVALGRAPDGRTVLCGGWGYLLGDEGSGYAIGRRALRNALQSLESGAPPQPLARAVLQSLGAGTIMELTRSIYETDDARAAIAGLAPSVIQASDDNDSDAQAILDAAAADLAQLVRRTVARLALETADPVALAAAGGVLTTSRRVQTRLDAELRRIGLTCQTRIVADPLVGCVRLADPAFAGSLVTWH